MGNSYCKQDYIEGEVAKCTNDSIKTTKNEEECSCDRFLLFSWLNLEKNKSFYVVTRRGKNVCFVLFLNQKKTNITLPCRFLIKY